MMLEVTKGISIPNFTNGLQRHPSTPHHLSFVNSYSKVCGKVSSTSKSSAIISHLSAEWNHDKICSGKWISFSEIGNFTADDFIMKGPRHLVMKDSEWIEYSPTVGEYLELPDSLCIFTTKGWYLSSGM